MFGFIKKITWLPILLAAMLIFLPATWLDLMWRRVKALQGSAEDAAQLGDYYYEESLDELLGGCLYNGYEGEEVFGLGQWVTRVRTVDDGW